MTLRRKISQDKISQSFNLERLLGYKPSERQKNLFYELAVDKMVDRTAGGEDVNSKDFAPYTKEYADKKGVDVSAVDLILEGDMLNGIKDGSSKSTVKIEMNEDQTDKAYGHISGFKGHPTISGVKKRDFFGFKKEEDIQDILSQVNRARGKEVTKRGTSKPEGVDLVELRKQISKVNVSFKGFDDGES